MYLDREQRARPDALDRSKGPEVRWRRLGFSTIVALGDGTVVRGFGTPRLPQGTASLFILVDLVP